MQVVTSTAALQALDPTAPANAAAILSLGDKRTGLFEAKLISSMNAAEAARRTADTLGGIYITSTNNPLYVYKRVHDHTLLPEWWGADPTNTADSIAPLNASVAYGIQIELDGLGQHEVVLAGKYRITTPLEIFKRNGSGWTLVSITVRSVGGSYTKAGLYPTYTDRPVVIVQAARTVDISALTYTAPVAHSVPTLNQMLDGTVWWDPTSVKRDEAHTPHCAIAIDPFGNSTPPEGAYTGYSGFYTSTTASSIVRIKDCEAFSFVVAFAASLGPNVQLGDSITYENCVTFGCKVAYAAGQSQNRGLYITNPHAQAIDTFVDCQNYGNGAGPMPNILGGVLAFGIRNLINVSVSIGTGNGKVSMLYAEQLLSLGYWGNASSAGAFPLTIENCELKFALGDLSRVSDHQLYNQAPVNFVGGSALCYASDERNLSLMNNALVSFNGTLLSKPPVCANYDKVTFKDVTLRALGGVISDRVRNLVLSSSDSTGIRLPALGAARIIATSQTIESRHESQAGYLQTSLETSVTITVSGDNATFTATDPGLYKVGDDLFTQTAWTVQSDPNGSTRAAGNLAIGRVSTIVGTTITLDMVPISFVTGSYSVLSIRFPRVQARAQGTTTNASDQITGVTAGHTFAVGHRIRGAGIPEGARILAIAGSDFTMSTDATASATVDLYDALVKFTGRASSAPASGVHFQGDVTENSNPTVDGNSLVLKEWLCTVSGSPGTQSPMRASTVSPAT